MAALFSQPRSRVGGDISLAQPSLRERILNALPAKAAVTAQRAIQHGPARFARVLMMIVQTPTRWWNGRKSLTRRHFINLPNAVLLFWVLLVWWSEKGVFYSSMKECEWGDWEPWVSTLCICFILESCEGSRADRTNSHQTPIRTALSF